MTTKEANTQAVKLFNRFVKYKNKSEATHDEREQLKNDCLQLHGVVGIYEYLTDKNALKMASICSTLRFVEPFKMLMQLQKTTGTY